MNLKEFNSLTDLFFYQFKKQNPNDIFLEWLNPVNRKKFTWSETRDSIYKFTKILKEYVKEGDRVLLLSENRPEWFMSDLAIMLSKAITVPTYTTYVEKDYKYLVEDCEPSIVIVSNDEMHNKLKDIIKEKDFIKRVIIFDEISDEENKGKYLRFDSIIMDRLNQNIKIKNLLKK